jgi:hypothetical protein
MSQPGSRRHALSGFLRALGGAPGSRARGLSLASAAPVENPEQGSSADRSLETVMPWLLMALAAWFLLFIAFATVGVIWPDSRFNPDDEQEVCAAMSALTLVGAACTVALAIRRERLAWLYLVFPAFLAFAAIDEFFYLHERLEAWSGRDWELLYVPIILAAMVALLLVLYRWTMATREARALLAGALAWLASLVLEAVQWRGDVKVDGYTALMFSEEVLEVGGSSLFLLAGVWRIAALGHRQRRLSPLLPADKPEAPQGGGTG